MGRVSVEEVKRVYQGDLRAVEAGPGGGCGGGGAGQKLGVIVGAG